MGNKDDLVLLLMRILENAGSENEEIDSQTESENIELLALDMIQFKKQHLIESLLERDENAAGNFIPEKQKESLSNLRVIYKTFRYELTVTELKEISQKCSSLLQKVDEKQICFTNLLRRLYSLSGFCLWCSQQPFLASSWSTSSLFQLCLSQPSRLKVLKTLQGLHLLQSEEVFDILEGDVQSVNLYRGFLSVSVGLQYLLQDFTVSICFAGGEDVQVLADELEKITDEAFQLEVAEMLFSLIFLRQEDLVSETLASDSAGEDEAENNKTLLKPDRHRDQSFSSPNSQSHSGSTLIAKKEAPAGFLCKDAKKLQTLMKILSTRLNALESLEESKLKLRRKRLMQYVSEALWRLELLEPRGNGAISSGASFSSKDGNLCVSKSWLSRVNPNVQKWFDVETGSRKPKKRISLQHTRQADENLVNRLLSQPTSLLVTCMTRQQIERAAQIAELCNLWDSLEGTELKYYTGYMKTMTKLRAKCHIGASDPGSSESSSLKNRAVAGLNNVELTNIVEANIDGLTCFPAGDDEEFTPALLTAVALSDVLLAAPLPLDILTQVFSYIFRRVSVDLSQEPWRTMKSLSLVFSEWENIKDMSRVVPKVGSPWRCVFPFRTKVMEENLSAICTAQKDAEKLKLLLKRPFSENLDELILNSSEKSGSSSTDDFNFLHKFQLYVRLLLKVLPLSLQQTDLTLIMSQKLSSWIFKHLEECGSLLEELEIPCRIIGIELPCLIANYLTSVSTICDLQGDGTLIGTLFDYLQQKDPVLAEAVRVSVGVLQCDGQQRFDANEGKCDLYHRYLCIKNSSDDGLMDDQVVSLPKPIEAVPEVPDLDVRYELAMLENMEKMQEKDLGSVLLSALTPSVADQVRHLKTEPLLLLEQLLMNGQIGAAGDVLKTAGKYFATRPDLHNLFSSETVDSTLLQYASKALYLGLTSNVVEEKKQPNAPMKNAGKFVLPASAPLKEQWVQDNEVVECPCCANTQFSMFNRRHHCRRCGRVVCGPCSPYRELVTGYGDVPVRVCMDCYRNMNDANRIQKKVSTAKGSVQWSLGLVPEHNEIVKREFSYEHVPNISLALAILNLSSNIDEVASFLLSQSVSIIAILHQHLLSQTIMEIDPVMLLQLAKSLSLAAKMRYSDCVAFPQSKAKPSRGLARCDAVLSQVDILSLLASTNCLSLLPSQPLSQLDTWRKLRDRLMERELWTVALDVSTKAGLDAGTVWASWGLDCLKAGNFIGARQRFARCLKPGKNSPLLQEVITTLENLSINMSAFHPNSSSSTRTRRLSSSNTELLEADKPLLVIASLARLQNICDGLLPSSQDDAKIDEILFYLTTYGTSEAPYVYLVEKTDRIGFAVHQFSQKCKDVTISTDVFLNGIFMPSLRCGRLEELVNEMKKNDPTLETWKGCLYAASQHLETQAMWHSAYQLYSSANDFIRASLVALRKLYLSDLTSLEIFVSRTEILGKVVALLGRYIAQLPIAHKKISVPFPLSWPEREVQTLLSSVKLQIEVTRYIETLYKEGKVTSNLIKRLRQVTSDESESSSVPSLFGNRTDRYLSAVLVIAGETTPRSLELAWRICHEQRVRLEKFFEIAGLYFTRQNQAGSFGALADFLRQRLTSSSPGYFDMDTVLLGCVNVAHENNISDADVIVQQIKKMAVKIEAYIVLGWLKAAYLLAVKNNQAAEMLRVQKEAEKSQQQAIFNLCKYVMLPRRVRFDSIDVHPTEKALIIFYDIYVISYREDGSTLGNERKECQKLVRLQSLNSSTDIIALSKEVLHQCKLIPAAKLTEVQQLLSFLRERPERVGSGKMRSAQSVDNSDFGDIFLQSKEEASLTKLDHYIELLYEDINAKNRGTSLILQLAKERENLDDLSRNESLLHALTRVIREDGRKHYSVAINITFVFLYFASYSQFHELLVKFKVGSMIVSLIEWELQRYDQWQIELQQMPEANLEDYQRKVRTVLLQQTLLLRTCFYILLHLAEDPIVEDKMRQKNIAALLVQALQRRHNHNSTHELLYLVLTFLQKLSIFNENKTELERLGVVEKAAALLEYPATYVRDSAARVLYNLSFDHTMRTRMGRLGIIPSLIRMMAEDEEGNNSGWALVYNISMDDRGRALITRTECFAYVLELLTRNSASSPSIPLALAINLATVPKLAEQFCKGPHFKALLFSALANQDANLMKLLRNAVKHSAAAADANSLIEKTVDAVFHSPDEHFLAEALGFVANVGRWATGWKDIIKQPRFINWIEQQLKPGTCAPDVQLALILVLGSAARDLEASCSLLDGEVVALLLNLLRAHQEDDEFVLQILYVFYNMCRHESSRKIIISQFPDVPAYIVDLMTDQNAQVHQLCDMALELIAESDPEWRAKIINERFCWHNAQWIEAISKTRLSTPSLMEELDSGGSSLLGLCVQHADILERTSTSASSFGSPESRVASPVGSSLETWDSHYIDHS